MKRIALVTCLLWVSIAHAYPIPPRTLWNLASEAEVIVVATVVEFHGAPQQPNSFAQAASRPERNRVDFVRLRVSETIKGKPLTEVDVVTNAGMMCPAPPHFIEGKVLVAFLSAYNGEWIVTALSYGVLYPSNDELRFFKSLLTRAVSLQQTTVTDKQRIEWALEAASHRATRWHGVYELQSASDSLHKYYDRKQRPPAKLTKEQQLALAKSFVAEPSGDHALSGIIDLLEGVDVPGLDAAFVGAIEVLLEDDRYTAVDAMRALVRRKKGDVDALIGGDHALSVVEIDAAAVWKAVRAKYSLPAGAKVPRREQLPLGEDTPF